MYGNKIVYSILKTKKKISTQNCCHKTFSAKDHCLIFLTLNSYLSTCHYMVYWISRKLSSHLFWPFAVSEKKEPRALIIFRTACSRNDAQNSIQAENLQKSDKRTAGSSERFPSIFNKRCTVKITLKTIGLRTDLCEMLP